MALKSFKKKTFAVIGCGLVAAAGMFGAAHLLDNGPEKSAEKMLAKDIELSQGIEDSVEQNSKIIEELSEAADSNAESGVDYSKLGC
ncbi:MAG: hypothetical protein ACQESF_05985 [Nanobdellota archaeon]